jgi:hypothetical protein
MTGRQRHECPACGRLISDRTSPGGAWDHLGRPIVVLYPHNHPDGSRCPNRLAAVLDAPRLDPDLLDPDDAAVLRARLADEDR